MFAADRALARVCGDATVEAESGNIGPVPERVHTIELLAIQFWIHDPGPIKRAAQSAGFIARIKRVDIEPALNAALGRQHWDLLLMDPATPNLSIEAVRRAMKAFRCSAPLIVIDDVATLPDQLQQALCGKRS